MNKSLRLFAHLTKIDEAKREVWGVATAEVVDKDAEMMDYASSKPYFEAWSKEFANATNGKSLGNVREMHQSSAVGRLIDMQFDDEHKVITVGAKIVDERAWVKCAEGVYTGFSIGGRYIDYWPDKSGDGGEIYRFTAQPVEISVVDNPACPVSHFTAVKADGSTEVRKFAAMPPAAAAESTPKEKETVNKKGQIDGEVLAAVAGAHAQIGKCMGKACDHDSMHECMKSMHKAHKDMGDAMVQAYGGKEAYAEALKAAGIDPAAEPANKVSANQSPDAANGEPMKPEQEQQLSKAASDSASALTKVEAIAKEQAETNAKLAGLESGVKELAEAFKQFVEGFGKAVAGEPKRVGRTHVVGKEADATKPADEKKEKTTADLMKEAHQNPSFGDPRRPQASA